MQQSHTVRTSFLHVKIIINPSAHFNPIYIYDGLENEWFAYLLVL